MRKQAFKKRFKDIFPAIKWPEILGDSGPIILGSKGGFDSKNPLNYPLFFDIRSAQPACCRQVVQLLERQASLRSSGCRYSNPFHAVSEKNYCRWFMKYPG